MNFGCLIKGSGRSGAPFSSRSRRVPTRLLGAGPADSWAEQTPPRRRCLGRDRPAASEARATPPPPPDCPPVPPAAAMSSSSSSPRETYEEDREYESQAKRLKTEEGEIDYSAEEGENRREATPRGGGDGGGGGGRSFSQPVTKRGVLSGVPGVSPGRGPAARTRPGPPAGLLSLCCRADQLGERWFFSLGLLFSALPVFRILMAKAALVWPQAPARVGAGPELGEGRGRGRWGNVASARGRGGGGLVSD